MLTSSQLSEGRYNARDVLATARLYQPLAEALEKTQTVNVYLHDREMAKLALQMHRQGMPIDETERNRVGDTLRAIRDEGISTLLATTENPEFVEWIATYQAAKARKSDPKAGEACLDGTTHSAESAYAARVVLRRQELERRWAKLRSQGKNPIKLSAKVQQAAILRCAGVELKTLTKSGIPKISKETLEIHAANPVANALRNYGLTASIIKTFVEGLQVDAQNFIHPHWLIHKITGRWGSNPNVQNWSVRAGGGAENLRKMVKAPENFVLVGGDFAQLEARILACLSRDKRLIEIFSQGRDIHAEMAAIGFPKDWPRLNNIFNAHGQPCSCTDCKARKKLRDLTKRLEYGGFYGGAPEVLWRSVVKDWPSLMLRDIENFVRNMNAQLPSVMRWRTEVLKEVTSSREVRSPFLGRRETFPLGRVDPGVAYNYKAQSGGADLWCLGALDYMAKYPQDKNDGRVIHNGHDSVLILARKETAELVRIAAQTSWTRTIDGVTFPMDFQIGERWSDV